MTIADQVMACLRSWRSLSTAIADAKDTAKDPSNISLVSDEFGRFRVWSSNIGAHRSGRASLDYKLRDASHIQNQVLELLKDLKCSLDDAAAIVKGDKVPWDELAEEAAEGQDDDVFDDGDEMASTELSQILADINEINIDLLRFARAVRTPAPHERFLKAISTDTSYFFEHDKRHVEDKFPNADPSLLGHLGRSISKRRQFFKYREQHQQKLAQGLMDDEEDTTTIASSLPSHLKVQRISALDLKILDDDTGSDSGQSATSYAGSEADPSRPRVPALAAKYMDGQPFPCPLCYILITINSTHAWKKHVYSDLRPYVCLVSNCPASERPFATRHEWIAHEQQQHWREWTCVFSCPQSFTSQSGLEGHIKSVHSSDFNPTQLSALIATSERPSNPNSPATCPLCQEVLQSQQLYLVHVGRHQQDLAIFALPKLPPEFEDKEENEADVEESVRSLSSDHQSHEHDHPDREESVWRLLLSSVSLWAEATKAQNQGFASGSGLQSPYTLEKYSKSTEYFSLPTISPNHDPNSVPNVTSPIESTAEANAAQTETTRLQEPSHGRGSKATLEEPRGFDADARDLSAPQSAHEAGFEERARKGMEANQSMPATIELRETQTDTAERGSARNDAEAGGDGTKADRTYAKNRDLELPGTHSTRPSYMRIHRDHLDVETLNYYGLPWHYDAHNANYFIILQEMDVEETDILFNHTRRLRQGMGTGRVGRMDWKDASEAVRGRHETQSSLINQRSRSEGGAPQPRIVRVNPGMEKTEYAFVRRKS